MGKNNNYKDLINDQNFNIINGENLQKEHFLKGVYWNVNHYDKGLKKDFIKSKQPEIICLTEPGLEAPNFNGYNTYATD